MNTIKNEKVSITFYEKTEFRKQYILIKDLTDVYNETTGYTKKIRGLEKAWAFIIDIFKSYELKEDLNFGDITEILDDKFNLDVHTYCAID